MGVHFAPVTSHPEGMYVPVHCFLTDSQLCRHRSFTTHPKAHPADGAGRSQLHTQEECSQCPQASQRPILLMEQEGANCTHRKSAVNALSPSGTTGTSGSPGSLTVELVTAPVSRLSAGHQQAVTAFCWSPTSCHSFLLVTNTTGQVCVSVQVITSSHTTPQLPKHCGGQNTSVAKTLQMPKHCRCQNTADARTLQLPIHHTTVAKTPQLPKHCRCQNTTDAKTLQMPKHHGCQMV